MEGPATACELVTQRKCHLPGEATEVAAAIRTQKMQSGDSVELSRLPCVENRWTWNESRLLKA